MQTRRADEARAEKTCKGERADKACRRGVQTRRVQRRRADVYAEEGVQMRRVEEACRRGACREGVQHIKSFRTWGQGPWRSPCGFFGTIHMLYTACKNGDDIHIENGDDPVTVSS